ncbi:MAG: polysaccharide pyruvyl transferase family protein [Candidatus Algichlamydia australiensis]|nr:polysaccharide pyruvyl transferase family protein [Chlamydiales bacterium]
MKFKIVLFLMFRSLFAEQSLLLLNDTSECYHWGCTGTSQAMREEIQEIGYALESISILDLRNLEGVPSSFSLFDEKEKFQLFKQSNPSLCERLKKSDIVVINGEGSIHMMRPLPRALLYVAYISKKFFGKHTEIINHSCFPEDCLKVDDEETRDLYAGVYKTVDYVCVREPLSRTVLNSLGVEKVDESFDSLPLYIRKHYTVPQKAASNTIVLAGSVDWKEEGMKIVVQELKKLEEQGYKIQVLVGAKDRPAYDDKLFVEFLSDELKSGWELIDAKSLDEWLGAIANADLLVSGRFHHTIAAICLKTPFVVLNSNTPKIEGMLSIMPNRHVEVLQYLDPDLETKIQNSIDAAFQMSEETFPTLEIICEKAQKKFSNLQSYEKCGWQKQKHFQSD